MKTKAAQQQLKKIHQSRITRAAALQLFELFEKYILEKVYKSFLDTRYGGKPIAAIHEIIVQMVNLPERTEITHNVGKSLIPDHIALLARFLPKFSDMCLQEVSNSGDMTKLFQTMFNPKQVAFGIDTCNLMLVTITDEEIIRCKDTVVPLEDYKRPAHILIVETISRIICNVHMPSFFDLGIDKKQKCLKQVSDCINTEPVDKNKPVYINGDFNMGEHIQFERSCTGLCNLKCFKSDKSDFKTTTERRIDWILNVEQLKEQHVLKHSFGKKAKDVHYLLCAQRNGSAMKTKQNKYAN